MCLAIGEAHDLVFDRGTVRGPVLWICPEYMGTVQVRANQVVDGRIGVGDVAVELGLGHPLGQERKRDGLGVSGLGLER